MRVADKVADLTKRLPGVARDEDDGLEPLASDSVDVKFAKITGRISNLSERSSSTAKVAWGAWGVLAAGATLFISLALWTRSSAEDEAVKAMTSVQKEVQSVQKDMGNLEKEIEENDDQSKERSAEFIKRHDEAKVDRDRFEDKLDALMMYFLTKDKAVLEGAASLPKD